MEALDICRRARIRGNSQNHFENKVKFQINSTENYLEVNYVFVPT
jgi:hypothetical protein